jgi:hypothetical protein
MVTVASRSGNLVNSMVISDDYLAEEVLQTSSTPAIPSPELNMICFSDDDLVELSILRGQEIDELVEQGLLLVERRFDEDVLESFSFSYPEMVLDIKTGATYPAKQLSFEVQNLSLPRLVVDHLKIELRRISIRETEVNNIRKWNNRSSDDSFGVFEFEKTALHLVQKTVQYLTCYRKELQEKTNKEVEQSKKNDARLKNGHVPLPGINLSTIQENATAAQILGKSPETICEKIPSQFRVLHVESVIRKDLYRRFLETQDVLRRRFQKLDIGGLAKCVPIDKRRHHATKDELIDHLLTPKLTFHGTSNRFVPSIVRAGFLNPGDKNQLTGYTHGVRCGSTYGQGIYTSPSASFALSYSGEEAAPTRPDGFWGLKLIVCATIMGRSAVMFREDNWRDQHEPFPGADSHVANNEQEYIVFDKSQIIPCYVVHLDWGEDNKDYFGDIPDDKDLWQQRQTKKTDPALREDDWYSSPGDRQRAKEALIAKASKYFPYGYGSATGTRFVVEDVAEVDEDEEEYGAYQGDRNDVVTTGEKSTIWEWDSRLQEIGEHDEYAEAKLVKPLPLRKKSSVIDEDD